MKIKQDKIEPLITLLKPGKPLSGAYLAYSLKISQREVRKLVNYISNKITPQIITGNFGYKWEPDISKIESSLKRIKSHAVSELIRVRNQLKLLKESIK